MVKPRDDDRAVEMTTGDPWNDWKPQVGKLPSTTTIRYVREWARITKVSALDPASLSRQEIKYVPITGDELAARVLTFVFPDWARFI